MESLAQRLVTLMVALPFFQNSIKDRVWISVTSSISRYREFQVAGQRLSGLEWAKGKRRLVSRWLPLFPAVVCIYKCPSLYIKLRFDILPFKLEYFWSLKFQSGSPSVTLSSKIDSPTRGNVFQFFGLGKGCWEWSFWDGQSTCVYVSKTRAHPEGSWCFSQYLYFFVLTFPLFVWSVTWPHVSISTSSAPSPWVGGGSISSAFLLRGLASAPKTVAQCPWGWLHKPLKDRAHFRAVGQKDPFHSIAESREASLSLSSPPFIKLLLCSKQLHTFSLILRKVMQSGYSSAVYSHLRHKTNSLSSRTTLF